MKDPAFLFELRVRTNDAGHHSIMGHHPDSGTEEIDSAPTHAEAKRLVSEYSQAFGSGWRIWSRWTPAPRIIIRAFDQPRFGYNGQPRHGNTGHSYIDVEVRHGGKVIFPRGVLWCGVNAWTSTDGIKARELVMALVAMRPSAGGGEGDEYYRDYTEEQLQWAETYGEALNCERESRYCDPETGDVRS